MTTILFTGLPASGKSTLANELSSQLLTLGLKHTLLDGDEVRLLISSGLGFSQADRLLNMQRLGFIAGEIMKYDGICIIAAIAPFQEGRDAIRCAVEKNNGKYIEVYVDTSLECCIGRDPKQLYKKALNGELKDFTGINQGYEKPIKPNFIVSDHNNDFIINTIINNYSYLKK